MSLFHLELLLCGNELFLGGGYFLLDASAIGRIFDLDRPKLPKLLDSAKRWFSIMSSSHRPWS